MLSTQPCLTMREAGLRVQPNLNRYTVAGIVQTFQRENRTERLPVGGGRERLLSPEQETEIVNMVLQNNAITLRQLRRNIIENNYVFQNVPSVSISTVDRVLRKHQLRMKQIYRVPFSRNSDRVKELRHNYVQRILDMEVAAQEHKLIFIDEAGLNLAKHRRRGRNYIGQRAIIEEPGQRGGNITMCAAIGINGVIHQHANLGPYTVILHSS
ncbi:uncharacterized protein LOC134468737 [Engraulis encrasicolus]|uniref:uncharacterized protein LOC134468737 n=1 Tax=Engraulis encrasicolus TaxID=184585 RepID=UPI002FD5AEBB